MSEQLKQAILSAVRSILITIGGVVVAGGWMDDATIQSIIGTVMVIIPAIWGVYDKFASERKTKEREVVAIQETVHSFTDSDSFNKEMQR